MAGSSISSKFLNVTASDYDLAASVAFPFVIHGRSYGTLECELITLLIKQCVNVSCSGIYSSRTGRYLSSASVNPMNNECWKGYMPYVMLPVRMLRKLLGIGGWVVYWSSGWLLYVPPGLTFTNSTFCPHSVFICVLCGSQNKQRLFPYTALTGWFV
jgi:hypothetical protein